MKVYDETSFSNTLHIHFFDNHEEPDFRLYVCKIDHYIGL